MIGDQKTDMLFTKIENQGFLFKTIVYKFIKIKF